MCTGENSSVFSVDIQDFYANYSSCYTYFDYDTEDFLTYNFYDYTWVDFENSITEWNWDFGDGEISSDQNPTHTYTVAGEYLVTLTTTDQTGCVDNTWQAWVWVGADAWYPDDCQALFYTNYSTTTSNLVEFQDFSWQGMGAANIVDYQWNFGDNTTSNIQNPLHQYAAEGEYEVELKVITDAGCESTYSTFVYVNGSQTNGILFFPSIVGTKGATCRCTNMSGGSGSWDWDYGDNTKHEKTNGKDYIDHDYATSGIYVITLTNTNTWESYATRVNITVTGKGGSLEILQSYAFNGAQQTSIKDIPGGLESMISIFPNPAKDKLSFKFITQLEDAQISLYNVAGQEVKRVSMKLAKDAEINISNLTSGVYFANISSGGQNAKIKFIK